MKLTFVSEELIDYTDGFAKDKSVGQLRSEYRLNRILSLFRSGELKIVVLRGPYEGRLGYKTLRDLAAWLRAEYALGANLMRKDTDRKKPARFLTVRINEGE